MESSKNTHENDIIKAIEELGKNPSFSELVDNLVVKGVMSEDTLIKYLRIMVKDRKLFRNVDGKNITYELTPDFFQYIMPSSEEQLSQWIKHLNEYLPQFAKSLLKMSLLDKVLRSGSFYQRLRSLCTWHEVEFLRQRTIQEQNRIIELDAVKIHDSLSAEDKAKSDALNAKAEANAKYYLPKSTYNQGTFLPLRDDLYGLITKLFAVIDKDPDGKTIHDVLELHVQCQEEPIGIPFIMDYNRRIELAEERLKEKGPPLIFTDAKGKPHPSVTHSIADKKIPLEDENKKL